MLWLVVATFAYLILAIVFLVDKYLLAGRIPDPKVYAFYVGISGILALILVPFVDFYLPEPFQIILSILAGVFFIYGIFWFYKALHLFEASRVVPAIGGILPIFTFLLIYLFSGEEKTLKFWEFLAFILLVLGSVLITYKGGVKFSLKSIQISILAAFFLALSIVFTKYVYLAQPFWSGYIWIRIGTFLMGIFFLLTPEVKNELFRARISFQKKTATIFLSNQAAGAGATILQNWAIALAPLLYVAFINALQGVQYVFLLIFATLLSLKFPKILKEEISREAILQKIIAILIIGTGLVLLTL